MYFYPQGVYVGPFQPSWNLETLTRLGITHILCIAESREQFRLPSFPLGLRSILTQILPQNWNRHLFKAKFPHLITYLILEIRDADDQNLIRIFPQTMNFIDLALSQGGKVLVHCGDGISRSPAVVFVFSLSCCREGREIANVSPLWVKWVQQNSIRDV